MSLIYIDDATAAALDRLLEVAYRQTGQGRRVANFLLAWWNADECGGFDLTDVWGLDSELRPDVLRVFSFVARREHYPDTLGWNAPFKRLVRIWREHLITPPPPPSENPNAREAARPPPSRTSP